MKKIQKDAKTKTKVSSKLSKGGAAYRKRVKKVVDKFKSLVSSKKAVAGWVRHLPCEYLPRR